MSTYMGRVGTEWLAGCPTRVTGRPRGQLLAGTVAAQAAQVGGGIQGPQDAEDACLLLAVPMSGPAKLDNVNLKECAVPNPTYYDGDLRAALVQAALDLIREDGLGTLTLRGVARRAGVSHAAPAHHVGDLAGLFAAIAVTGHEVLAQQMTRAAAAVPRDAAPGEVLAAGVRAYVAFAAERPELAGPMFRRELWERHSEPVDAALRQGYAGLRDTVLAEQERGWRPHLDPDAATQAVWALAQGVATLQAEGAFAGFDLHLEGLLALLIDARAPGAGDD